MSTSNINIEQVLSYLSKAFHSATQRAMRAKVLTRDNTRGTELHAIQVEFCYLQSEIEREAAYIVPKRITQANELIARIVRAAEESEATDERQV